MRERDSWLGPCKKTSPSALAQNLVVRVDKLLVILDEAKELLGIVDRAHRLLQDELVILDGPAHLFVYEHGLQSLGSLCQPAGLVVPQTRLSGRKTTLHGGLVACRIVVVAADVANDPGIHIEDALGGTDHGAADRRRADHLTLHVLADHHLQRRSASDSEVAPPNVPPAQLLAHRLEAEDLGAPHLALQGSRVLAIPACLAEQLPLHALQALGLGGQPLWLEAAVDLVPYLGGCAQSQGAGAAPVHLVAHAVHQIQLPDALVEEAPLGGTLEVGRIVDDVVIPLVHHAAAVARSWSWLSSVQHSRLLVDNQLLVLVVNRRVEDEDLVVGLLVGSAEHHQLLGIGSLVHGRWVLGVE